MNEQYKRGNTSVIQHQQLLQFDVTSLRENYEVWVNDDACSYHYDYLYAKQLVSTAYCCDLVTYIIPILYMQLQ